MRYTLMTESNHKLVENGTIQDVYAKLPAGCRKVSDRVLDIDGKKIYRVTYDRCGEKFYLQGE